MHFSRLYTNPAFIYSEIFVVALEWLVEVCWDDGDPITLQIPLSPGKLYTHTKAVVWFPSDTKLWYRNIIAWCLLLSVRWKVDAKGAKVNHSVSKRPILQFVSIKRKDCGEWAIPGVGDFDISPFLIHLNTDGLIYFLVFWWDLLSCICVFLLGDGGCRGASVSHPAEGVLRRSTELSVSATSREKESPWTHH